MKNIRAYILLLLIVAIIAGVASCTASANATGLMANVKPGNVSGKPADSAFIESMADFSIELFKKSITDRKNSLISPFSVTLALAMTANGAGGETLAQMERLLGGDIPLAELNEYLYSYASGLPNTEKAKFAFANSIWFRGDNNRLRVSDAFLQTNANYYGADAFASEFDSKTVRDINNWVKTNTNGMIGEILDRIDPNDMLFMINAVVFDAEWQSVYNTQNVRKGDFTDINGAVRNVDFMHGAEYGFLNDGMATGFIKPYAGGRYGFAALLPNEDISIEHYIDSLTGAGFINILGSVQKDQLVFTSMPKFKYDYSIRMNAVLETLGMVDAFDIKAARFDDMAVSSDGNIFISSVIHKTYIEVDERGTRAGAVTMVAATGSGAARDVEIVNLDRPFIFAIIDNVTNLPIFIGTVMSV